MPSTVPSDGLEFAGRQAGAGAGPGADRTAIDRAWQELNSQAPAIALPLFENVLRQSPVDEGALQGKAASLRALFRFDEAQRTLDGALALHPEAVGLLAERAWLHLAMNDVPAAIAAFEAVIRTGHADEGILLWHISLLRRERLFDRADQALAQAARRFPDSAHLRAERAWLKFHRQLYREALQEFESLLADDPAQAAFWQGRMAALRKLQRYAEARQVGSLARRHCLEAPGILAELGWLDYECGLYRSAESHFTAALAFAPADGQLKVCLALSLFNQHTEPDYLAAERHCAEALAANPFMAAAHGCLGLIAFKRGYLSEAEHHLKESTRIDPRDGQRTDLGSLYRHMGRLEEAESCFVAALASDPMNVYARMELAELMRQTGRAKEALCHARQAHALAPENPAAHLALADALDDLGQLDEAEVVLRAGICRLVADRRSGLHLALCRLLTRLGDAGGDRRLYEEALAEAGHASVLAPGAAPPYFYKGVVKHKLGDLRGSMHCFELALQCDSGHLLAELNRQRLRVHLRQERKLARATNWTSGLLSIVLLVQIAALWHYLVAGPISITVFAVMLPVLLGLLVVAMLLPWLSRLKLTGLEAELRVPQTVDAPGPKGEIRFSLGMPLELRSMR